MILYHVLLFGSFAGVLLSLYMLAGWWAVALVAIAYLHSALLWIWFH